MDLKAILDSHKEWFEGDGGSGKQANLRNSYLRGADLRGANLMAADLRSANLTDADLTDAKILTGWKLTKEVKK